MLHSILSRPMRATLIGTFFLVGTGPAMAQSVSCDALRLVPLDTTFTLAAEDAEARAVHAPGPGWLAVELHAGSYDVAGGGSQRAWVDLQPACDRDAGTELVRLDQTQRRQVVAVDAPGVHPLRFGAVTPSSRPRSYKVSIRFLAAAERGTGSEQPPLDSTHDGEESENEIPPTPPPPPPPPPGFLFDQPTDGEESENEIPPPPQPPPPPPPPSFGGPSVTAGHGSAAGGSDELADLSWCPSLAEPADDLTLCARSLSAHQDVAGELRNPLGDDHDYYVFSLDRARVVRLESAGTTDTVGILFDSHGQRLAGADDGGDGENFAFVAALAPGRYFLRVEGALGAEGEYRLLLEEVE